ncbi:hypothetical protein OIU85_007791 [Salix viminalis]|uniref:Uncharacterized protein n=1 Tax=Salix viminalis TaxID=40686 RepID=A0A9Q0SP33_SALVM|nr:hypothetical protein OIU85_007791 [Salix viminalis]
MDSIACNKVQPAVRKVKKKQVKGEMDRLRQAEKKRRRLEKALATSAAIRSELEQKKQKKKEEQQRLDEEGAAIAEAVALHVLLGEDSDDSCKILLNKEEVFNTWSCDGNIDLVLGCEKKPSLPHEDCSGNSFERIGWVPSTCGTGCQWGWGTTEFSAGLIAAQAVSSLQIAEDAHGDTFLFDGMLRG